MLITDPLITILVLILFANAAPVLLQTFFNNSWLATPIDHDYHFIDGKPLLGKTKTWRGLLGSLLLTTLLALALKITWTDGFMIALLAMSGDLSSSFIKRRMGLVSSKMAPGLDQFPESGFPLLYASQIMMLFNLQEVLTGMLLFLLLELFLSRIFFYLGVRKRPY